MNVEVWTEALDQIVDAAHLLGAGRVVVRLPSLEYRRLVTGLSSAYSMRPTSEVAERPTYKDVVVLERGVGDGVSSKSMSATRALKTGNPTDWAPRDCLVELLRRFDAGELHWNSMLVIGVEDQPDDHYRREVWRANLSRGDEALQLLIQQRELTK